MWESGGLGLLNGEVRGEAYWMGTGVEGDRRMSGESVEGVDGD